jgi:acetyl-CoA synthetase
LEEVVTVDRYVELHRAHRWSVPADFNVAQACCRRWATDRTRFALYWEDESGARSAWTYFDIEQQANRLSNALVAMGAKQGDRIALMLPQRPETAIAHIAINQIGAIAVPLSFLFGPDALEYRLEHSGATIAFVDPQSLPNLAPIRERLPGLSQVIGVAGARESWITSWEALQESASRHFAPVATRATDPAFLVYTSGTTGPPKGALMPQSCVLGNLPGFAYSHDGFPQAGDLFWTPSDWAWTGGLMDALLPTFYFGQPIVGYRGRFDPERALRLIERYQIRNAFLVPTALKLIMKAYPRARDLFDVDMRSIMSAGEAVGTTLFEWDARSARRPDQRDVRTNGSQLYRRQFAGELAREGRLDGTSLSWTPDRRHRRRRRRRPGGTDRRDRHQSNRARRDAGSGVFPRVLRQSRRHARESTPAIGVAPATWRASMTTATSGIRAAPTTCSKRRVIESVRPRSRTASSSITRSRTPPSCLRRTRSAATW